MDRPKFHLTDDERAQTERYLTGCLSDIESLSKIALRDDWHNDVIGRIAELRETIHDALYSHLDEPKPIEPTVGMSLLTRLGDLAASKRCTPSEGIEQFNLAKTNRQRVEAFIDVRSEVPAGTFAPDDDGELTEAELAQIERMVSR